MRCPPWHVCWAVLANSLPSGTVGRFLRIARGVCRSPLGSRRTANDRSPLTLLAVSALVSAALGATATNLLLGVVGVGRDVLADDDNDGDGHNHPHCQTTGEKLGGLGDPTTVIGAARDFGSDLERYRIEAEKRILEEFSDFPSNCRAVHPKTGTTLDTPFVRPARSR